MPRSRLFMLMLAALLIAQSALGTALHRCHDGVIASATHYAAMPAQTTLPHCHGSDHADVQPATTQTVNHHTAAADHATAPHGLCTCAIAHCAPALISQFEFTAPPTQTSAAPLYRFSVANAPAETLLRPPIILG